MHHRRWLLALVLSLWLSYACAPATPPDPVTTGVSVARAVAATLTAESPIEPTPIATAPTPAATPDLIATGVIVHGAIAATLTAAAPTATATPIVLPTHIPDLVATAYFIDRAVAATHTAATATAPSATPRPTFPPDPSATPSPVPTPVRTTAEPPTPQPSLPSDCVPWTAAADHVAEDTCICGTVVETYDSPTSSAFFINFSTDRTGYYAVSFEHTFAGLEGKCVKICGLIETYNDRPQTIIHDLAQIQENPTCP